MLKNRHLRLIIYGPKLAVSIAITGFKKNLSKLFAKIEGRITSDEEVLVSFFINKSNK
jgi:hypothetical protein